MEIKYNFFFHFRRKHLQCITYACAQHLGSCKLFKTNKFTLFGIIWTFCFFLNWPKLFFSMLYTSYHHSCMSMYITCKYMYHHRLAKTSFVCFLTEIQYTNRMKHFKHFLILYNFFLPFLYNSEAAVGSFQEFHDKYE